MPTSPHPSPLTVSLNPQLFPSPILCCPLITLFPEEYCSYLGVYQYPRYGASRARITSGVLTTLFPQPGTQQTLSQCLLNGHGRWVSLLYSQIPQKARHSTQHPQPCVHKAALESLDSSHWGPVFTSVGPAPSTGPVMEGFLYMLAGQGCAIAMTL